VLERAFEYWKNVDKTVGDRIERGVRSNGTDPGRPSA
jgi:catalase